MQKEQIEEGTPVPPAELLNKADWHNLAATAVRENEAVGSPSSIIFADISWFKRINDRLGHGRGDAVIEDIRDLFGRVDATLRSRPGDLIGFGSTNPEPPHSSAGHIGGDEFVIFARTDAPGAQLISDRVRDAFGTFLHEPRNQDLHQLGIGLAVGTATHRPGMPVSELLSLADQDMYADKRRQLPDLSPRQRVSLWVAHVLLERSGFNVELFNSYPRPPARG
ncbi:MAG: GGDEF domain-containing protein [Candidatus Saccharibacteria bacterium]